MSDPEPATTKAATKQERAADHPPYFDMIKAAISALKERGGSSRQAIEKYIKSHYKIREVGSHLKMALKRAAANGRKASAHKRCWRIGLLQVAKGRKEGEESKEASCKETSRQTTRREKNKEVTEKARSQKASGNKTSGEGTRGQEGCCKEIDQETSQETRSCKALQKACH